MMPNMFFLFVMVLLCGTTGRLWAAEGDGPARGRQIYLTHCAICHGERGDGQGPGATPLQIKPRDFTSGLFKFRSTPSGMLPLDRDLYRTLSEGIHGTSMIPQIHLSPDDRWAVIQYLKGFSARFVQENPAKPIRLPPLPADLHARREQGRQLYADAGCVQCHGVNGRGNGPSARELQDVWGNPIRPKEEELWALVAYVDSLASPERYASRGMMGMMGPGEEPLGRMIEMMNRMGMCGSGCIIR